MTIFQRTSALILLSSSLFISCGKKDAAPASGADSAKTTTSTTAPTHSGEFANPNNATYSATFDGKPVELNDSNRWSGVVMGGMSNDGKKKISTVNITMHGKNRSDYLLSFDMMDGKTGSTNNANAIVNLPGQSFTGKKDGKASVTITKAEPKDDRHTLYSGDFEVEMAKIAMNETKTYILKGSFSNILVLHSTGILKGIGDAVGKAATNMKGK